MLVTLTAPVCYTDMKTQLWVEAEVGTGSYSTVVAATSRHWVSVTVSVSVISPQYALSPRVGEGEGVVRSRTLLPDLRLVHSNIF
jgi:hypothetical protein